MDSIRETVDRIHALEHTNRAMELELLLRSIEDLLSELDDRTFLSSPEIPHPRQSLGASFDENYEDIMSALEGLPSPRLSVDRAGGTSVPEMGGNSSITGLLNDLRTLREQNETPSPDPHEDAHTPVLVETIDSDESLMQRSLQEFQHHWEQMLSGMEGRSLESPSGAGGATAILTEPSIFEELVAAKPVSSMSKRALQEELERERNRMLCTVCLLRHKRMLLVPCRHACMCRTCAGTILTVEGPSRERCPVCRTPIVECWRFSSRRQIKTAA